MSDTIFQHPKGTVVGSPITTGSGSDAYGSHFSYLGIGGYREVSTILDRDTIRINPERMESDNHSCGLRRNGMMVRVDRGFSGNPEYYVLEIPNFSDLSYNERHLALRSNEYWKEIKFSGSSSPAVGFTIYQTNHGFVPGDVVSKNEGDGLFSKASAFEGKPKGIGIITAVPDEHTAVCAVAGVVNYSSFRDYTGSPLIVGNKYYLYDTSLNPGKLSVQTPSNRGFLTVEVLTIVDDEQAVIHNMQPTIDSIYLINGGNADESLFDPRARNL